VRGFWINSKGTFDRWGNLPMIDAGSLVYLNVPGHTDAKSRC
jgi:hypothetical protein